MTDTILRYMIAVILAGGLGKRMMSEIPKVLHIIDGRPMLVHVICQARMLGPEKIYIVVGKYQQLIATALERYACLEDVSFIQQETPKGTGHALQCCLPELEKHSSQVQVLVLSGDVPFIRANTLSTLVDSAPKVRFLTTHQENPSGYGRVLLNTNGYVERIIEEKDCNEAQRGIQKINGGIYCFRNEVLLEYLNHLSNSNAQEEYYLTDIVGIASSNGICVETYELPQELQFELTGINTKEELDACNKRIESHLDIRSML